MVTVSKMLMLNKRKGDKEMMTVRELMSVVTDIENLAKRMEEGEEVTKEDKDLAVKYLRDYASDLGNINIGVQQ